MPIDIIFGAFLALGVEHVEGVLQVREELLAGVEPLRRGEAHVVGIERVGHDQVRLRGRPRSSTSVQNGRSSP